ncbi:hypothetical protein V6S75_27510, partial [Burkholderia pseudomallei]
MSSRAPAADAPLVRHTLVRVCAQAWPALLAAHGGIGTLPFVRDWAARGWPLIVRRRSPCDAGVPLGLPLPPSAGKRRVARPDDPRRRSRSRGTADTAPAAAR